MITNQPSTIGASTTERIKAALAMGGTIDITTHGRRSGQPRRIEIVFFNLRGRVVISGMPGRRGWYANLLADPRLIVHLKHGVQADLPARARLIADESERRELLTSITRQWRREAQLERFVAESPLVELTFDDPSVTA